MSRTRPRLRLRPSSSRAFHVSTQLLRGVQSSPLRAIPVPYSRAHSIPSPISIRFQSDSSSHLQPRWRRSSWTARRRSRSSTPLFRPPQQPTSSAAAPPRLRHLILTKPELLKSDFQPKLESRGLRFHLLSELEVLRVCVCVCCVCVCVCVCACFVCVLCIYIIRMIYTSRAENRCWSLNQHLLVVKWLKMLIFDIKNYKMLKVFVHILGT